LFANLEEPEGPGTPPGLFLRPFSPKKAGRFLQRLENSQNIFKNML
jgi:hypothetical protein